MVEANFVMHYCALARMGAGCSSSAGNLGEPLHRFTCPPRPPYLACDLVGPPVVEKIRIGPVDALVEQAVQFASTVCSLNDSLNGVLLDVRLATGLLQGGFSLFLSPSPNVDIFTVQLLTALGRPLEVAEAARLRGQDLTRSGKLSALDAQLAQCLEWLADAFVNKVGVNNSLLTLSSSGTLVSKTPDQSAEPVVDAFNQTMLDMRAALGEDYLLALHIHKAQSHGTSAFRVRLLKPEPKLQAGVEPGAGAGAGVGTASPTAAATTIIAATTTTLLGGGGLPGGFVPVTVLDQSTCLNASRLTDARHAFQDANGRLAAVLKLTGLVTSPLAVVPTSPRTVALAGTSAAASASSALNPDSPSAAAGATNAFGKAVAPVHLQGRSRHLPPHRIAPKPSAAANKQPYDPQAAAAVRSLPSPCRLLLARAVEALNGAVHSMAHAAAAAPGPASFAALLTHVLGELRDVVGAAGGDCALERYRPGVYFRGGPDQSPTLEFTLDPQLDAPDLLGPVQQQGRMGGGGGGAAARGAKRAHAPLLFPDCLSPEVRRAWLLLQELIRVHNRAVEQLESLRQLAAAFEDGLRRRTTTLPHDARVAGMSSSEASEAGQALLRDHVELRSCWQGALHVLTSTALLVREEMAEAAQLAKLQCSFMSPTAWSISVASSSASAMTSRSGVGADSSLSYSVNSGISSAAASLSATPTANRQVVAGGGSGSSSSNQARSLSRFTGDGGGGGGTSIRICAGSSATKSLADSFAAAAGVPAPLPGSPPDATSLHGQQQHPQHEQQKQKLLISQEEQRLQLSRSSPGATSTQPPSPPRRSAPSAPDVAAAAAATASTATASVSPRGTLRRSITASSSRTYGPGWVPLDDVADGGDGGCGRGPSVGGPTGQSQSPMRPSAAAVVAGRAGRAGSESLAEEYALAALAHLQLQNT